MVSLLVFRKQGAQSISTLIGTHGATLLVLFFFHSAYFIPSLVASFTITPLLPSTARAYNQKYHERTTFLPQFQPSVRNSWGILSFSLDNNIDVKSLLNQEQEIGIANRAVHEASLMQSIQERLLAPTDVERLAAIKRVKQSMSKARARPSSSMGFGKSLSSAGRGKSTTINTKSIIQDNSNQQPSSTATRKPPFQADKEGYNAILEENGVVRINNVLNKDTAQVLYSYICEAKVEAEKYISEGKLDIRSRFSDALLKKNRYDFLLPLEESTLVMRGLYETLVVNEVLGTIISSRFGNDAELYELGALISDPGSDRQVIHPDIPFQSQQLVKDNNQNHNNMPLLTCFISLQEIDQSMGGTIFLPKTNTEEHHRLLKDHSARDGMLQTSPNLLSTLGVGDCSLFDARLLHAGGANSSNKRRILFYFTFRNPALPNPRLPNNPGSIRRELKERNITLSQIQEIVSNALQQEEIST